MCWRAQSIFRRPSSRAASGSSSFAVIRSVLMPERTGSGEKNPLKRRSLET
jgi:hypothetical protein